jgi:hypothetical protein
LQRISESIPRPTPAPLAIHTTNPVDIVPLHPLTISTNEKRRKKEK